MKTISISLAVILLASCAPYLSPYTAKVQNNAGLTEEQLKQIQFYVSTDIVLYRNVSNAETAIFDGELKVVNGQKVEEIIIDAGTPGVVIGKDYKGALLVSFENDSSYLRFGPNHGYGGKFTMMAKDWDGRTGVIDYGNKEYHTSSQSIYSYLMISMKQINNTSIESREAAGRTLYP